MEELGEKIKEIETFFDGLLDGPRNEPVKVSIKELYRKIEEADKLHDAIPIKVSQIKPLILPDQEQEQEQDPEKNVEIHRESRKPKFDIPDRPL